MGYLTSNQYENHTKGSNDTDKQEIIEMIIGFYGVSPLNGTSYSQVTALKEYLMTRPQSKSFDERMNTFPTVVGELRGGKSFIGTYLTWHPELMYRYWLDGLHRIAHERRLLECAWD
jgi:hypothetical protein